jgi:hypothetical protein
MEIATSFPARFEAAIATDERALTERRMGP